VDDVAPLIELSGITFGYPGKEIFQGLNFSLNPGDRIGLIGPNGSGKTTLLRVVMGLLKPAAGEVRIFGKPRRGEKAFREVRKRISLLFQDADDQLFCPTVREDIAFGPLNLGKSPEEANRIVERVCSQLGLEGFEDRVTYRLSGGEKKLVCLGTLLAMEPEVLLLDEPTASVDVETTNRIAEILNKSDLSCLLVSHDRRFLVKTTRSMLHLKAGVLTPVTGWAPEKE
jgi:cobalt/nickel transport system ATP-binding protein